MGEPPAHTRTEATAPVRTLLGCTALQGNPEDTIRRRSPEATRSPNTALHQRDAVSLGLGAHTASMGPILLESPARVCGG